LQFKEIARWKDTAAPVVDVEELSDEAGAALLRDNGVWGTGEQLKAATSDFGGHPLALGLLASFIKETQFGDIRRRDHIRAFFADAENPRHDHARRVMESYDKEWLTDEPVEHAIMQMIGLFDRPASGDLLLALRQKPNISGFTDRIIDLEEGEWQRAVARLRGARLLAPIDTSVPGALDAHPLVREWFGVGLEQTNKKAWHEAHGRLYEHLRDTTSEGKSPTLEGLAPLYQAIAHGCKAGRHQEVLDEIYKNRLCRRLPTGVIEFYSSKKLGALGSNIAGISWFFEKPFETPVATLTEESQLWVLGEAAYYLRAQGRFAEALAALRTVLRSKESTGDWDNAATFAGNLSEIELLVGDIKSSIVTAATSVEYADKANDTFKTVILRTTHADALCAGGFRAEAEKLFEEAELRQKEIQPDYPLLYSVQGYQYCDLILASGDNIKARERATQSLQWVRAHGLLLAAAVDTLTLARAHLGMAFAAAAVAQSINECRDNAWLSATNLDKAIKQLRDAGVVDLTARGLIARAAFQRSVGDWLAAASDLNEVEEVAEPGPMRLHLCDMALERARLALARVEAFAPLSGLFDRGPPKPVAPDAAAVAHFKDQAATQLASAANHIKSCGYHRRDEELEELQAVLRGERKFADLPPRV
jgi:tetratricopeptide (TPR) repeat protein